MDRHENVLGIKYSAPDLVRIQDYPRAPRRAAPDALIGCDSLILCALQTGASGTVSGPAAVFGKRFSGLYADWRRGDLAAARVAQERIIAADRAMAGIPQIPAIKAMLRMLGVIECDACRKPLRALTAPELKRWSASSTDI